MSDDKMNKRHIIPLLKEYKKHPSLWNPNDKNYKNQFSREKILNGIIEQLGLGMTVRQLRLRIKNLRTTYVREVNRIIESQRGGDVHKPKLIWFDVADSFLRPVVCPRLPGDEEDTDTHCSASAETVASTEQTAEEHLNGYAMFVDEDETQIVVKEEDAGFYCDEEGLEFSEDDNPLICTPQITQAPNKDQTKPSKAQPVAKTCRPMQTKSMPQTYEDEFDTFGRHVANQLRGLPLCDAIKSQNYIHNFLSEERLKHLAGALGLE